MVGVMLMDTSFDDWFGLMLGFKLDNRLGWTTVSEG